MKEIIQNLWICDYSYFLEHRKELISVFDKIVTVAKECSKFETIIIPLEDGKWVNPEANERLFLIAIDYVHRMLKEGKKVLVHCVAGISRSCAVIMGVLMQQGMRYDKMRKYMHKIYPQGTPDQFFISILIRIELAKKLILKLEYYKNKCYSL